MKTIPLTHGRVSVVDDADFDALSQNRWNVDGRGYCRRVTCKDKKFSTEFMHRKIMGLEKGDPRVVDHINGDPLDNRRENLRVCSQSQNSRNRAKQADNTSGFKGASFHKQRQKWAATITVDGKQKHLGLYESAKEAHEAYCVAADSLHGEFANHGSQS